MSMLRKRDGEEKHISCWVSAGHDNNCHVLGSPIAVVTVPHGLQAQGQRDKTIPKPLTPKICEGSEIDFCT